MREIIEYCQSRKDQEAGGVIQAGIFLPLENIADDPKNQFEFDLSGIDYDSIDVIVHSHINGISYLSDADRKAQVASGKEWWLVVGDKIHKYKPVPLLRGREFIYGKNDCGTLIEDAMHLCGINLRHYQRGTIEKDAEIGKLENTLPKLGFERIDEIVEGAVILTSSGDEANHAALYIGDDRVLHHIYGGISKRAFYGSEFRSRTHSIWLHKEWKPGMIEAIDNDLRAYEL